MPKPIAILEVKKVDHWLSSKKREEVFGGVVKHICSFVQTGDSKRSCGEQQALRR